MMDQKPVKENLQKAIDDPIAFFDLFNFPLTALEVWKYLPIKKDFFEVNNFLLDNYQSYQGFYFFKDHKENINIRKNRYNYTDVKFKKAMRITKIFRFIPWIKGIAIGNIIGAHNLKKEGDIDFFIITSRGRIWLTRFICVMIIKLLRMRPHENKIKDKICLSFFVSQDNLDLRYFMIPGGKDFYFIYWLAGLVPIYGDENFWVKFYQANNWISAYLPNWQAPLYSYRRKISLIKSIKIFEKYGRILEKLFKKIQLKILSRELRNLMNKDTRVVINDRSLKMHFHDRREYYNKEYLKLVS